MQSRDLVESKWQATPLPLVQSSLEIPTTMKVVVSVFCSYRNIKNFTAFEGDLSCELVQAYYPS